MQKLGLLLKYWGNCYMIVCAKITTTKNLGGQPEHVDMDIHIKKVSPWNAPILKYPLFHVLIDYPSAIFILCISAAVRWKMKCFGLGWKRKLNLVLSPWIWIFLAYQCQVSPLTNKWMYVTKFSSLDHAIFRCCNVTWHVTCDGCDTTRSTFFCFAGYNTTLYYTTPTVLETQW